MLLINCAPEVNFDTPELRIEEPNIEGTKTTIDAIQGVLGQAIEKDGENAKVIFKDTNSFIEGYVVSSDKASNFFKEMILQDKSTSPTAGIRVLLNKNPVFTKYEFGRKVYIQLDGLSIGIKNGVATLGVVEENTISAIPSFVLDEVVQRSTEIAAIEPLEIAIEDFRDDFLNLYVKVNNIQFNKNIVQSSNAFTFAAEPNDVFDGERILESCNSGRTTILSTSTFSDFKGFKLPENQGSFEGILTKNFLGDAYNLILNNPLGLVFENETRCDPIVLECELTDIEAETLFEADFTGLKTSKLDDEGWISINSTNGKLTYKIGDFNNNQYVQITGFRSKESLYEVWLISPEIILDTTITETLNFDLQAGYDNGNILEVFVTTNFTGDPTTTTWTKLDATIPRGPLNGFGTFIPAGPIGLSCIEGTIRLGYKYLGGDPRATTRYHIDNIKVTAR